MGHDRRATAGDEAERATSVRTELIAGVTTFFTMAYIVVVNPSILAAEGTGKEVSSFEFRVRAACVEPFDSRGANS
ncbi:MAG TPA: hypothetical protein VN228_05800 [Pyrinomonadaceae bacterium]|nr:hypothetical protein [Pyrinomonadaceae bacterium]